MNIRRSMLFVVPGLLFTALGGAADNPANIRLTPTQIGALAGKGASAGASGVSGIQTRVLKGDPTQPGFYTIQLEVPANTRIEAHDHPDDRAATVIAGTWYFGYGSRHDEKQLKALAPGSFYTEPPHEPHFARTGDTAVVLQISGIGPTGTAYLPHASAQQFAFPAGFNTQEVETNGATIHVRVGGKGPAVVLLHGYGETGDMWIPLAADLARDHTVVVPDLRGLGRSSKPAGGFDKKTQAGDVAGVLDALKIDRADFVTHDIGNMVGFAFAAMLPQRVDRFVLIDAPVPGIGPWEEILKNPLLWHFRFGGPDMERLVAGRERIYLDRFWNEFSANPSRFTEAARAHYAELYALPGAMHSGFAQFAAFDQDAIDNRNFLDTKGKLQMPMLALGGEKSFGPQMAVVMRAGGANVTGGVVPDSGHWIMEENPGGTIKIVRAFLESK
jgi:pimeloyl-ACP methyl ester carboxylesterase/quercetin dioxygenase-like cupin family protein